MANIPGFDGIPGPPVTIRAAQYVRMSTEHQKYSTENQAIAIQAYAERRGISIIRTYADEGKSGLSFARRHGLKQLIDDVRQGRADYAAVLVYDVSRWGRFQDADESAHYEFICKEAGISVHYCAEPFENDGSLVATILKNMKRAMAGEYSRELSTKVFVGHCKLASLGFRQGGIAGYGLRRQLIDEQGRPKGLIEFGQRKSLQTDRVVLVPGPPEEIEVVKRIYDLYANDGQSALGIAKLLNAEGRSNHFGRPWRYDLVRAILTSEKYAGTYIYNQVSMKLGLKRCINTPEMFVRAENAFVPLVDPEQFHAVQAERQRRLIRISDAEMLEKLRSLHSRTRQISALAINNAGGMPSSNAYKIRFGSLSRAYDLACLGPRRGAKSVEIGRLLRNVRLELVERVKATIIHAGGAASRGASTHLLQVNDNLSVSIAIARCQPRYRRWQVCFDRRGRPDFTVAARMDEANRACVDYYIFPHATFGLPRALQFYSGKSRKWSRYRYDSLESLLPIVGAARLDLKRASWGA
ncbi:recombinase family protein [Dongia sedimenti]|uniref:Recombinase family protein n=1 Tax=Dongia sedimenti TaxID=3064282 RepID=A0ABU0YTH9_9PROT|nr:recombinase family protein [Rhodospirillaceae bacterium R-7]